MKYNILAKIKLKLVYLSAKEMSLSFIGGHFLETTSIKKDDIVFDLGGNLGNFSKAIIEKFGCNCYVVEPNPQLFEQLPNHPKVIPLNYAITKSEGDVEFNISDNHEASSIFFSIASTWNHKKTIVVKGRTLKRLIDECNIQNNFCILKVDIEGAELELFKSLSDIDICSFKQITVEFHESLDSSLSSETYATIRRISNLSFLTIVTSTSKYSEVLFLNKRHFKFNFYKRFWYLIHRLVAHKD